MLVSCDDESIVLGEELAPGIVVANAIVKPVMGKIPIRILNITNNDTEIKDYKPKLEKLLDYELVSFCTEMQTTDRVEKVLNKLDLKHLNSEEKDHIQRICAKYSDIFYLEGETLSTTNLME